MPVGYSSRIHQSMTNQSLFNSAVVTNETIPTSLHKQSKLKSKKLNLTWLFPVAVSVLLPIATQQSFIFPNGHFVSTNSDMQPICNNQSVLYRSTQAPIHSTTLLIYLVPAGPSIPSSTHLSLHQSVHPPTHPSIHPCTPSMHPPIRQSIHPPAQWSIHYTQ